MITIEMRIKGESVFPMLEQCASLLSRLERLLFKALYVENEKLADAKRRFISEHRITARQFNGVHRQLEGRVESWREARKLNLTTVGRQIKRTRRAIASGKSAEVIHQKKRRLQVLEAKRKDIEGELAAQVPSICFGSKALFQEQFYLEENGHLDHAAWQREWRAKRASSFFVLGSADETAGNQTCQYRDGALHLRLPDALGGATVAIPVAFRQMPGGGLPRRLDPGQARAHPWAAQGHANRAVLGHQLSVYLRLEG